MTTRNCSEPRMSLMEKENGKTSSLKLQSRKHLCCPVAAVSIWCPSSRGLEVPVCSRASLTSLYLAREIKSKEIDVLIVYPMSLFMDRTEPDLLSTNPLFLSLCTHEPQGSQIQPSTALMGNMAQANLDPVSTFPSSPEAFPRFPTSPTEQTDKCSTSLPFLIPLPRWSGQGLNPSLVYPLQTHNSVVYCCRGFTFCIRLL